MEQTHSSVLVAARVLMALIFIVSGLGKLGDVAGFGQYMASGGIPAFLAWPVVLFEIGAGLALLAGAFTRPAAVLLAAFSISTAVLYHNPIADPAQMSAFLKNLALAGGYLLFFAYGSGPVAIDAHRQRLAAA